ncbi:hypothetical protein AMATHDRAFT_46113 [Amanita thiersii Skay4041]|uniref:Uncharacterized protein n=1 Tax=Amanita thiersii Skay4041 TaxID=703135 RepID=A0A2A9NR19_9AGAR|nr:hypothetical protein AMATHDRAFT_46113 [Amanita thiersii Skay4041]
MENKTVIIDRANDDIEARQRFESFKLGKGLPSGFTGHRPTHSRSHSRNVSISSLSSLPTQVSKSCNSISDENSISSLSSSPPGASIPNPKRNSHHRRRSSVSTRRESAEMMGVSLPELPPSLSEDNVNLGEKDSIRRRALWALEGKPDVSFSKVEIPELSTPQMEKLNSDFRASSSSCFIDLISNTSLASKPSFPPSPGGVSNLLGSKRDSFKLLAASSSTKDQLHTLVEEEEEEEEQIIRSPTASSRTEPLVVSEEPVEPVKPVYAGIRPASLNLRPLALTPENLSITCQGSPLVSSTGTRNGLRSLSLSSTTFDESPNLPTSSDVRWRPLLHSRALHVGCESTSSASLAGDENKPARRSSISYKTTSSGVATNLAGLPTPEVTPTFKDRRFSFSEALKNTGSEDEFFPGYPSQARPLSASEQHFLVKSHNALLARITDLEKALSMRRSSSGTHSRGNSRPVSLASDFSLSSEQTNSSIGEPNDEMLQLIADLKAERDEYKRDIDGWRNRVKDLDDKLAVMVKRVETERREAWIARSRVGILEVEKTALEQKLQGYENSFTSLQGEKSTLKAENEKLHEEVSHLTAQLSHVKKRWETQYDLEQIQQRRDTVVDTCSHKEEDNTISGYEDEDSDISFQTSSSIDSLDISPSGSIERDRIHDSSCLPSFSNTHATRHSLSKAWTFPTAVQPSTDLDTEPDVDKFFGCLENIDDELEPLMPRSPSEYDYEKSKGLFSEALKAYNTDNDSPFVFPGGPEGEKEIEDTVHIPGKLETVLEEEEEAEQRASSDDEEDMFGEAGGICIMLTPAQEEEEEDDDEYHKKDALFDSGPPVLPPLNFDYEADDVPSAISFNFDCFDIQDLQSAESRSPTPKAAFTASPHYPSSIPRLKSEYPSTVTKDKLVEGLPRQSGDPFSTPPTKRGGRLPSLIPQPVSSPSPSQAVLYFYPYTPSPTREASAWS